MTTMETRLDTEMTRKVDLINKKIDEINQRRYGLRTTGIEDELDRQELDDYIKSLNLTPEQKKTLDGYNKNYQRPAQQQGNINSVMMLISVFIEAYIGYAIIEFLMDPSNTGIMNTVYLYLLVIVFMINAFYILKFLRIIR